ncbi:sensor domain-containing protein [Trinickia terrae]|nr:bifunctional diguanylate cyclase/phosphodiesterase [Trinickia terrae]
MRRTVRQFLLWLKIRRYRHASERGFSYLAENASLYVCRYDRHSRFLYVSPSMAEALHVATDDLVGQIATPKRYPDGRFDVYHQALAQILATGEPMEFELTMPSADGRTMIHHVRLVPERDWRGRLAGALCIGRDITETKLVERSLRAQEGEFRLLAESSPDNIVRYDRDCRIIFANRNLMQRVNVPVAPIVGQRSHDISWGNELDAEKRRYRETLERVIRTGEAETVEVLIGAPDSAEPRLHHIKMVAERDENQQIKGALVYGRDITERKRMEELLAAREREFRSLAENLPDIIVRFDREGRRTYVNGAHERFTGKPPETFLGKTVLGISAFSSDPQMYHAEVRQAIETGKEADVEWKARGRDGIQRIFHTRLRPELGADGSVASLLAVARDMTEVYEYRSKIHQLAYFDALTGLANRTQFNECISQALQEAGRQGCRVGVLMMDLDRFKTINDTLGHLAGDQLLCEVARRLEASVRAAGTVARLGGDEFIVVVPQVQETAELQGIAGRVLAAVAAPVQIDGRELVVQASVGISVYPDHGDATEQLVRYADSALYRAKEAGRNNVQFYTRDITDRAAERLRLEADLRCGIAHDALDVHYQPKIDLATGRIVGAEALLRWLHPERGWIPPSQFIGIAEETGLIVPLAEQVMRKACGVATRWNARGEEARHIAVNLSPSQFHVSHLPGVVQQVLQETGCRPDWLELEITEGLLLVNHAATLGTLNALSQMGVRIAIDDFGTGYSALSYLTRFPIATLKIDRSFTQPTSGSQKNRVLVEAIVAMAHGVGLEVVAEGVETRELAEWLAGIGCDMGQGYLWSGAIPAHALLAMETHARGGPAAGLHDAAAAQSYGLRKSW